MDRLGGWITYFALSLIVMAALIDDFPAIDLRDTKTDFALGTAAFSMIVSLIYIAGHFFKVLAPCMGNVFELGITIISCGLWTIAISFIQDPGNKMATDTNIDGQETILNANLYFFSWLAFFYSVYQVGSNFEDRQKVDASFARWFMLLATSIILIANNTNTIGEACDDVDDDTKTCNRTRYGIAVGICGIILTAIIIFMTFFGMARSFVHVGISFIMLTLYFFGVALLTSASGPARSLGNTYFSLWGGFWISFQTFYELFNERMKSENQDEVDPSEP